MIRVCEVCGEAFESSKPNKKYCSAACREEKIKLQRAEREKLKPKCSNVGPRYKKPPALQKPSLIPDNAPPSWSLKGKNGDRVSIEAKALGMTYGQYTAACNFGTIERELASRGIENGQELIAKALREVKRTGRITYERKPGVKR